MIKNNDASSSTQEEVASLLRTNLTNGLTWEEAESRLRQVGYNEFSCDNSPLLISKYLEQFKNPFILLLFVSVIISIFMKQYDDAISITAAIMIVVTVAFIQEYRSEKSLEELNKLVPPSCKSLRAGQYNEFLARNLVPGDIVTLSMGDRVPADLRLFDCQDLSVDESSLTGETEPVNKFAEPPSSLNNNNGNNNNGNHTNNNNCLMTTPMTMKSNLGDNDESLSTFTNLAFMGTLVRSGNSKGIVINTGSDTQFGLVFGMMQAEDAPKSPLQISMDQLGQQLTIYSFGIVVAIVLLGYLQSRPMMEMFTVGVSLAVAAIPEGLPIVVTVTLALGVVRMAKKKAVVKKLPVVETLGCIHVVCTDKTGTLTKNEMTVTEIVTSELYEATVTGIGYSESGDIMLKHPEKDQSQQYDCMRRLLSVACICNNAHIDKDGKLIGQPTEGALIVAGAKIGLHNVREDYRRLEEIPFSSDQKLMAVRCVPFFNGHSATPVYYAKGAIERLVNDCVDYYDSDVIKPLKCERKADYLRQAEIMGSRGLRVLGIAFGASLSELTFVGMVGLYDPPRNGVAQTIRVLHGSGIDVKMVTGDAKATATSVARNLGLLRPGYTVMSGRELDQLNDSKTDFISKAERVDNVAVFYRVTPAHKVTIVKMLQARGLITAMTGDGVNDGVALKKADIGIAMGQSGTDVCKEAADVILVDDNLATIISAIEEGKGIFYNIRNFISFQLSTSIAALSLIAISTMMRIPNPLNAMQILYINIIMDGPPAQSLGVEKVDQDVLKQPPRSVKEPVLTLELLVTIVISSSVIIVGTLLVFVSEMADNKVTPRDTTMTFTCFVFFDMFNALACRSQTKSIFEIGFFTNKPFLYSVLGSVVGQMLVIYYPPLQLVFITEPLSYMDILTLIGISSTVFIVSEFVKIFRRSLNRRRGSQEWKALKSDYII